MDFDKTSISIKNIEKLSKKFSVEKAGISTIYENGDEYHFRFFICKAIEIGKVNIKPLVIKTENKEIKTNERSFKIID